MTQIRLGSPLPGARIVPFGEERRPDDVLPNGRRAFRCTQTFANPNGKLLHRALDIGNRHCGDPVLAAAAGRATVKTDEGGGLGVRIDHTDGPIDALATEYWHLSEVTVDTGSNVVRGQQIGRVGDSGKMAFGCHLHYVVFVGKDLQDPWPTLPQNHPRDDETGVDMYEWVPSMQSTRERGLVVRAGTLRKAPSHEAEAHAVVGRDTETPLKLEVVGKVVLPNNMGLWWAVRRKGGPGLFLAANSQVVSFEE